MLLVLLGELKFRTPPNETPSEKSNSMYNIRIINDPSISPSAVALWGTKSKDPFWTFTFKSSKDADTAFGMVASILFRLSNEANGIETPSQD